MNTNTVFTKEKENKKVIINKVKFSDGNNYYIDKYVISNTIAFHVGMILTDTPIHSLRKAKQIAIKYLNEH